MDGESGGEWEEEEKGAEGEHDDGERKRDETEGYLYWRTLRRISTDMAVTQLGFSAFLILDSELRQRPFFGIIGFSVSPLIVHVQLSLSRFSFSLLKFQAHWQ